MSSFKFPNYYLLIMKGIIILSVLIPNQQVKMPTSILQNKKILITAGPTREAIDPVRNISNHSSDKMGYALATEFIRQGQKLY